ncbi:MAG TPA: protease inhibitor I42 family protein [Kofleriaceae bacterium]
MEIAVQNQQISASVGEPVEITMRDTSGSTGFLWMVAEIPSTLLLEDIDFLPPPGTPMPGRPGKRVFTFIAAKPGDGYIRFVQVRPWEPMQPVSTEIYQVHVTPQ